MISVSHWGMFEIERTATVDLWRAIEEYLRRYPNPPEFSYDAKYLHG